MRIASFTMIGQFPHGIDLHVRNLLWALNEEDHIFIVTTPKIIDDFCFKNSKRATYIPLYLGESKFINFWSKFPEIISDYEINPKWFLFMEQDIWFFAKPILADNKSIISYLPRGDYRDILLNQRPIHPRIWEGAQLIPNNIVQNAISFGINFSFTKDTFLSRNKEKYEEEFGGKISLSQYHAPDTMDEFGLYCALIEKTNVLNYVKASHLRGPESIHRNFPEIYEYASKNDLEHIQEKIPYINIFLAMAVYYLAGNWKSYEFNLQNNKELKRFLPNAIEWMNIKEYNRLKEILK